MDETYVCGSRPSARVNQEWRRLCADALSNDEVREWGLRDHVGAPIVSLAGMLAASGGDRTVPEVASDRLLASLIAFAVGGDRLAARVILQRVLPSLVARSQYRASVMGRSPREMLHDFLAAAWLVICEFPIDRRPAKIVGNVVRDTEKAVVGKAALRAERHEIPYAPDSFPTFKARADGRPEAYEVPAAVLLDELVDRAVENGLSVYALDLLVAIHMRREKCWRIARDRGVTTRTVAKWRNAAELQFARALARSGEDFCG